jgi:hypothetical protein
MKRYSRSLSLSVAAIGLALASGCSVAPGASSPPPDLDVNESASQARSTDPLPLLELVSSGGIGRLYTLNENEARTAETVHHMSREPGQVGYMPPQRIAGTTPLYRLKPTASENRWLLTASDHERDVLASQQWVYEGVVGYVYTEPGAGREKLNRFTNGRDWRMGLESEIASLGDEGYTLSGMVGYVDVGRNR